MSRYPTMEQVETADIVALLSWLRFLPSPTDDERPTMDRIIERHAELKKADPAAAVGASKTIGW